MGFGPRHDARLKRFTWDARLGQFYTEESEKVSGQWEKQQNNIKNDAFRAVFDLANVQLGWIAFVKGEGVNAQLFPVGQDRAKPPSDDHDEGLRLLAKFDEALGGDVREMISCYGSIRDAFDALHDKYLAAKAEHPAELPIVGISGVTEDPPNNKGDIFFWPVLKIVGWQARPPQLPLSGIPLGRPRKKKKRDGGDAKESNGLDLGTNYDRPKPKDDMEDEIPF
jgi:hypothetical protein